MSKRTDKKCRQCSKAIDRPPSMVRSTKVGDFCDRQCFLLFQNQEVSERLRLQQKSCTKCKIVKDFEDFSKDKYSPDEKKSICKLCSNRSHKKWASVNPTWTKEYNKQYGPVYYEKNKTQILKRNEAYRQANYDRIMDWKVAYNQKKYNSDPLFRLIRNYRREILSSIKSKDKSDKSLNLLGCSAEAFKQHIENLFQPGMTWENHGRYGWHLDHIRPINTYDILLESEQRKCFHYTNYRPLWALDNLKRPKDGSDIFPKGFG